MREAGDQEPGLVGLQGQPEVSQGRVRFEEVGDCVSSSMQTDSAELPDRAQGAKPAGASWAVWGGNAVGVLF